MARYTIRVELHSASDEDYEVMHAEMEKAGFLRTIKSDDGKIYKLPPAEYNMQNGVLTLQEALDASKKAAEKTGCKYAVLANECTGRMWVGLKIDEPTEKEYKPSFKFKYSN